MAPTIDRRSFLKLGAAASGVAVGGCSRAEQAAESALPAEMRYRPLGNTGLEVSEVAFGAHGVDNAPLMRAAFEAGINTFCTSGQYLDGREEEALGRELATLGSRRDEVVVLTGNRERPGSPKRRILDRIDDSLRRLRTDRIEVYYSAEVRTPADLLVDELFEAFEEARQAGKVLHLGLSGHQGGLQDCLEAAIDDGRFGVFFTKYDFVSYPEQDEILHRAAEQGIGTIVFKTDAGNRRHEIEDLEAGGLSFRQATIRWALSNAYVAGVAVTITNFDLLRECTAAAGSAITRAEVAMLRRYAGEMYHRYCRFCGECEASCPQGVAIADVNRFAMYFSGYGREKRAMGLYAGLPEARSAAACEGCDGPCETACPFSRPVHAELVKAHRQLRLAEV